MLSPTLHCRQAILLLSVALCKVPSRYLRQKLWQQGRTLGSWKLSRHTLQVDSAGDVLDATAIAYFACTWSKCAFNRKAMNTLNGKWGIPKYVTLEICISLLMHELYRVPIIQSLARLALNDMYMHNFLGELYNSQKDTWSCTYSKDDVLQPTVAIVAIMLCTY